MGYTRYWQRTEKPITEEFVAKVKEIIKDANDKGIKICGSNGSGEPVLEENCVAFNGNGELGLDHESCVFDNEHHGFDFTKTACKPYDFAVRNVLKIAEKEGLVVDVSSDGENEEIISDNDWKCRDMLDDLIYDKYGFGETSRKLREYIYKEKN